MSNDIIEKDIWTEVGFADLVFKITKDPRLPDDAIVFIDPAKLDQARERVLSKIKTRPL